MAIAVDDPLIAGMVIRRTLPLHESSRRLRELYPRSPRVYGVAVLADISLRRWWALESAVTTDRLQVMFDGAASEMEGHSAARDLAAVLVHTVIGRVVALLMLEGRAWDVGLENLWVHSDAEGAIDWVAVVDPTLRALPDDPCFARPVPRRQRDTVVQFPGEAALATWVAHRCHRALAPLFAKLHTVSGGALSVGAMWHIVGTTVVTAATQVPQLAAASELTGMRRGQAVLDALLGFGLPVRGHSNRRRGALAKLGQPCLC